MDNFDTQRLIEFDFLRATEIAALNCMRWVGKGDKEAADAAACDAIRGMFDITDISGEVVIGEGIKDGAPGIFKGEKLGMWRGHPASSHRARPGRRHNECRQGDAQFN